VPASLSANRCFQRCKLLNPASMIDIQLSSLTVTYGLQRAEADKLEESYKKVKIQLKGKVLLGSSSVSL
jgi:hypothetical protein